MSHFPSLDTLPRIDSIGGSFTLQSLVIATLQAYGLNLVQLSSTATSHPVMWEQSQRPSLICSVTSELHCISSGKLIRIGPHVLYQFICHELQ